MPNAPEPRAVVLPVAQPIEEVRGLSPSDLPERVLTAERPLVLRGLVADWPAVQAARRSDTELVRYLQRFYRGATVGVFIGGPEADGRVFYNDHMTGFTFERALAKLDAVLDRIQQHAADARPPLIYVGSTTVDTCLPGLREENDLVLQGRRPLASIWLGNRTRIAAHFDVPSNLACCVAGRRQFVLFPPEAVKDLYVGPLDFTPAGQPISLVDLAAPDFERFPRFRSALGRAQRAELAPGDALLIPSMWWHHVSSLDSLNVLINYWWRDAPAWLGAPVDALHHAMLSIRDLPRPQRQAWKALFEHYVFDADDDTAAHIPEAARGMLSAMDDVTARRLRADLLNRLNR